jgi:hypothetical protein
MQDSKATSVWNFILSSEMLTPIIMFKTRDTG